MGKNIEKQPRFYVILDPKFNFIEGKYKKHEYSNRFMDSEEYGKLEKKYQKEFIGENYWDTIDTQREVLTFFVKPIW